MALYVSCQAHFIESLLAQNINGASSVNQNLVHIAISYSKSDHHSIIVGLTNHVHLLFNKGDCGDFTSECDSYAPIGVKDIHPSVFVPSLTCI